MGDTSRSNQVTVLQSPEFKRKSSGFRNVSSPHQAVSPLLKCQDVLSFHLDRRHLDIDLPPPFVQLDDPPKEEEEVELLGLGESIFNLVNTMVGSGVLSMPYAFKLLGYVSVLLLILVVLLTAFTAALIGSALDLAAQQPEALEVARADRDYIFLAQVAFGDRGRLAVSAVTSLELWLALVAFLVMNGVNANLLFGTQLQASIVCCTVLAALMVRIPMRAYAYVSLLSLIVLILGTSAFAAYVFSLDSWALPPFDRVPPGAEFGDVPRALGLFIFCFAGHPCFPNVHGSMRETSLWGKSIRISFAISLLYYGGLGIFAYAALGEDLDPCFTVNIAQGSMWHNIVTLAFLVKIQLTAPLILRAVLMSVRLMPETAPSSGGAPPVQDPGSGRALGRSAGAALVTLVTAASACVMADSLAAVASLCGNLMVGLTSIIFPAAFYVKLRLMTAEPGGQAVSTRMFVACLLLALVGAVAATFGTYYAVVDLVGGPRTTHGA